VKYVVPRLRKQYVKHVNGRGQNINKAIGEPPPRTSDRTLELVALGSAVFRGCIVAKQGWEHEYE
jgi:hypothetical protein